ncbi:hypothetical protein CKO44_19725 [Rubrivivax gelatinosus]|uniref:hypothetical protein n=1 Tax=Rubrivivax gelatinosus TaxID=28068 RepID=UPI0019049698|nr:hypothetical protein [Rubrivivax gelatinosus]MBK1615694.1 hypothetical protein [Rubrivivax gelatinosus]
MNELRDSERKDLDSDEVHPVATGVGAAVGGAAGGMAGAAAAGAAVGGMTGPVGAALGAVVGAVAGGLMGRGAGKAMDPQAEDAYWRSSFSGRPYVAPGSTYDDYGPAYRYGVDAYSRNPGRPFDELDADLERDWDSRRGDSQLDWGRARHASRDAWSRLSDSVERAVPGDSDRDGR